jgi:hypothetical protein
MIGDADFHLWTEWLSHYLERCQQLLRARERRELAGALRRGVSSTVALSQTVGERTATEGRWLVDFLVGVEDPVLRGALTAEAVARLGGTFRADRN